MTKGRVLVIVAAGLVLLVSLGMTWREFSVRVSTDDAQIEGHVNAVSARIGGAVVEVLVSDNQLVEKGTPSVPLSVATTRSPWPARKPTWRRTRRPPSPRAPAFP